MNLPRWAVRRPVTVSIVVIACLLGGLLSLSRLGVELLPRLTFPYVTVATLYPNADPATVEVEVTRPIEAAVETVAGVRSVESLSLENASIVVVELQWGTAISRALEDVRATLGTVSLLLPAAAQSPVVIPVDPGQLPLMFISLHGDDELQLSDLALDVVRPRLEQVPGVGQAVVLGGLQREIEVVYDSEKLRTNDITPARLHQMIQLQNVVVPAGTVESGGIRYATRIGRPLQSVDELADLVIGERKQRQETFGLGSLVPQVVTLRDLADVRETPQPRGGIVRVNGETAIVLRVIGQSGANAVQTVSAVRQALAELEGAYPQLQTQVLYDQASFITDSLSNVVRYGAIGAVFAALILFAFIRSIRSLLAIAAAIPLSLLIAVAGMHIGSLSLNLMSLGGLALGTGMLLDNAIIVLENIHRHRLTGRSALEAATVGTQEVLPAITASTLTTIAVFAPIWFVESLAGNLFRELGITVSLALAASLFVSVLFIPALGATLFRDEREIHAKKGRWPQLTVLYERALQWALLRRRIMIICSLAAFIATLPLWGRLGAEFLPASDTATLHLQATTPPGTPLEESSRRLAAFENRLLQMPEVQDVLVQLGDPGANDLLALMGGSRSNQGLVTVTLNRRQGSGRTTKEILAAIRADAEADPNLDVFLVPDSNLGPLGDTFSEEMIVRFIGPDLTTLRRLAAQLKADLDALALFPEVHVSPREEQPELVLDIQRSRALLGGLTTGQVGLALRQALSGEQVSTLRLDGRSLPVVVRPNHDEITQLEDLMNFRVTSPVELPHLNSAPVRLSAISKAASQEGPMTIQRVGGQRMMEVRALLHGTDLGTAKQIMVKYLDEIEFPPGYSFTFSGIHRLVEDAFQDLGFALVLALIIVYMVMAARFESWLHPLIIMATVPLAGIGSVIALFLTGQKLGATSLIGLIMLGGLVVNNGIVLLDYMNRLRDGGVSLEDAIVTGATTRLRPILMTAGTTLLGLLPLAIATGDGTELQKPMAIAVGGGLFSATLLTLFVIPCLYASLSRSGERRAIGQARRTSRGGAFLWWTVLALLPFVWTTGSAAAASNRNTDDLVLAAELSVDNRGGQSLYVLEADWNTEVRETKIRFHLANGLDPMSESPQTLRIGVHADWFRPLSVVGYQRILGDFIIGKLGDEQTHTLSLQSQNVVGNIETRFEMSYVEGGFRPLIGSFLNDQTVLGTSWDGLYQVRGELRQGQHRNLIWVRDVTWSKPLVDNDSEPHPGSLKLTSGSEVRAGGAWLIGKAGLVLEGTEMRPVLEAGARIRTGDGSRLEIGLASTSGHSPSPSLDMRYLVQGARTHYTSLLRAEYTKEGQIKPALYLGVQPSQGQSSWQLMIEEGSRFRLGWTTLF